MNKSLALKSRLNLSLGIISIFLIVYLFVCYFSIFLFDLSEMFYPEASDNFVRFYIFFFTPQFLYPLMTLLIAFLIPYSESFKFKDCIKNEKVPIQYFLLCIGIFPGFATISSNVSYKISDLLEYIGVPIYDVNSSIPIPQGPMQIILLFFVLAVFPAVCEELIYRGFLLGGISEYGKAGAIIVSSFVFGLIHATILQIPNAFLIGLFLSYIVLRFKSIVLSIILHFINNFIAFLFFVLNEYLDEELFNVVNLYSNLCLIVIGSICTVAFIILTILEHSKSKAEAQVQVDTSDIYADVPITTMEKVDYFSVVVHSWGFWLFTILYLFHTVSNVYLNQL